MGSVHTLHTVISFHRLQKHEIEIGQSQKHRVDRRRRDMGDISAIATLLTKIFGFIVDPEGLKSMKLEHELEVIHAGIKIAISKQDYDAIDVLFNRYRELSNAIP